MKKEKESVQNSALALLKEREIVFNALRSGVFLFFLQSRLKEPYESEEVDDHDKTITLSSSDSSSGLSGFVHELDVPPIPY